MFIASSMTATVGAHAQSAVISDDDALIAIELSQKIKDNNLLTENVVSVESLKLELLEPQQRLRHLRQHAFGTITLSNKFDINEILKAYGESVEEAGNDRDKAVFDIHQSFMNKVDLSNLNTINPTLLIELETAKNSQDWFLSHNAWLLVSVLNSFSNNPNLALQQAQEAFKKIPNEISPYVTDARISTLSRTTYLNNLLLNPDLAIKNTAELIVQKQAAGYPIDGSSLLNNLLYSLSKWREHEVSTQIAKTVLKIEKEVGSNTPGLTELRVAQLYDQQSEFKTALIHIRNGLDVAKIPSLRKHLHFLEVNSLLGLERIDEAKEKLARLDSLPDAEKSSDLFFTYMARAKLGLAIQENDKDQIYKLSNKLLDLNTQRLLRSYSTDTSKLVASLENTKERQAEREAGLKREANLQKAKAEQKTRVNQLLMIVVALLALAAISAVIFARFRDKVSKQLAIKTAQAEDADRMKSEFLGMVSHELRTPLNGIVGIADLLAMQAPTEALRHKAGIILDSSNKLTHVIESIVDMSRIDGDKMELYPELTNIHEIVIKLDQLWRPVIENKGVVFTSFVEESLSEDTLIDKARFTQCLNSLLSNAAKFTDSGRVHLHVTAKPVAENNMTEITAIIADTGQGMSQIVQEKLFTPFLQADSTMTRKHGGSGLGLAITQSLARMMGGDVTMVSNQDRGSEFTLTVRGEKSDGAKILDDVEELFDMTPLAEMETVADEPAPDVETSDDRVTSNQDNYAPIELTSISEPLSSAKTVDIEIKTPTSAEPADTSDTDDLTGLKVLIVEDITANQDVIKLFLSPEGCKIQCASNGLEALDILNTQAIDIILMDIRMPGMDGIEATRTIRGSKREYKNTPIIALTADASAETNAACMAAGADIFLTKPVMGRELIESIRFIRRFQEPLEGIANNAA